MTRIFVGPLAESKSLVEDALTALLSEEAEKRPFVVIEEVEKRSRFVQFVGSKSEPLRIDCPPLGIVARHIALADAPAEVLATLAAQGSPADAVIRILLVIQRGPGGGLPHFAFSAT